MRANKNKKISYIRLFTLIFFIFIFFLTLIFIFYKAYFFIYKAENISENVNKKEIENLSLENSSTSILQDNFSSNTNLISGTSSPKLEYIDTPQNVKGIYMSSYAASSQTFRNDLIKLLETTELNTIIIDVKDNDGSIIWNKEERMASSTLKDFIKLLHSKNIYVIARITVFEDPKFSKTHLSEAILKKDGTPWKNKKGQYWTDPASQKMWDYVADLAKTSHYEYGFDEINFDYVRFPTDGDLKNAVFPISEKRFSLNNLSTSTDQHFLKSEVIKNFFEFLNKELRQKENIKISADIFGLTTVASDDVGIGQKLVYAMNNFDYVLPMVYPSHFYPGTIGYKKPDLYPYEIIYWSMGNALLRTYYNDKDFNLRNSTTTKFENSTFKSVNDLNILKIEIEKLKSLNEPSFIEAQKKLRPWYQDFDMNGVDYGVKSVSEQIRAGNDLGINSFILWDASNKYTRGVSY